MITKTCAVSGQKFTITADDLEFYRKMEVISAEDYEKLKSREISDCVGLPTLCPEERSRRRMVWSNQRFLYKRKCDATGKIIISNFSDKQEFPVYDVKYFFSNDWNQLATGRDFDFSRDFFPQFADLLKVAPRLALQRSPEYDENSDYTNYAGKNKNCYLIFDSDKNWGCLYSYSINNCRNVIDSYRMDSCELCYECLDCVNCYEGRFLQNCTNCTSSWFLKNCIGCSDCFGCVNLRNKQFYFMNKPYSKEEYQKKIAELEMNKNSHLSGMRDHFVKYCQKFPYKFMEGVQNEDVLGNYLTNCKNAQHCFDCRQQWDCKYVTQGFDSAKTCMDSTEIGDEVELLYECYCIGYNAYNNRFSTHQLGSSANLDYCYYTPYCKNCFGCVGLHHQQYCIFNKQYTEAEYFEIREKIINHMKKTGEWGEFFPMNLAPFGYNLTMAQDHMPLSKEEILAKNLQWTDKKQSTMYDGPKYEIPDKIEDVPDDICDKILTCEATGKYYKIQKAELNFYRKMELPIPRLCPDERHRRRMQLRNPRILFSRNCADCGCEIQTTFAPDRPEKVLCEECYLKVIE